MAAIPPTRASPMIQSGHSSPRASSLAGHLGDHHIVITILHHSHCRSPPPLSKTEVNSESASVGPRPAPTRAVSPDSTPAVRPFRPPPPSPKSDAEYFTVATTVLISESLTSQLLFFLLLLLPRLFGSPPDPNPSPIADRTTRSRRSLTFSSHLCRGSARAPARIPASSSRPPPESMASSTRRPLCTSPIREAPFPSSPSPPNPPPELRLLPRVSSAIRRPLVLLPLEHHLLQKNPSQNPEIAAGQQSLRRASPPVDGEAPLPLDL